MLKVEGLEPNQKYVFAVGAYNSEGKLLGNTIGGSTAPLLASLPVPLLSTWTHLAQVRLTNRHLVLFCHLTTLIIAGFQVLKNSWRRIAVPFHLNIHVHIALSGCRVEWRACRHYND